MIELVGYLSLLLGSECFEACRNGFAGPDCSFECPVNCKFPSDSEVETCNYTTGECLHGCNQGYTGTNCSVKCPQNCASSNNSGAEICNVTSTECLYGCEDGFYGTYCNKPCSDKDMNCKRCSENSDDSFLCDKCKRYFYRGNTDRCTSCPYWCFINASSPLPSCKENDGYCEFGCKEGRLGYKCEQYCSNNCDGACHRDSGYCLTGCKYTGVCGPTCGLKCQDGCVLQHCNQSCSCVKGCNYNNWGEKCEKICSTNCQRPENSAVCDSIDGKCFHGCKDDSYWGNQCISCSSGCVNGICEKESGNCTNGCTENTIYGGLCNSSCNNNCLNGTCKRADGYCNKCVKAKYGRQCEYSCSTNCIDSTCERVNGSCVDGCKTGFYGDQCDSMCSDKCYGLKCERTDGNCTDGCISGYEGFHCLTVQPLKPATDIDTTTKYNKYINGLIGGTVSGWLSFVVLLVVFIIVQIRRGPICKVICLTGNNHTDANIVEEPLAIREHNEYISLRREASYVNASAEYETLDRNTEPITSN